MLCFHEYIIVYPASGEASTKVGFTSENWSCVEPTSGCNIQFYGVDGCWDGWVNPMLNEFKWVYWSHWPKCHAIMVGPLKHRLRSSQTGIYSIRNEMGVSTPKNGVFNQDWWGWLSGDFIYSEVLELTSIWNPRQLTLWKWVWLKTTRPSKLPTYIYIIIIYIYNCLHICIYIIIYIYINDYQSLCDWWVHLIICAPFLSHGPKVSSWRLPLIVVIC